MYKYAKEKLTQDLEKKKSLKTEKEREINEITEKLKIIEKYNNLMKELPLMVLATIVHLIISISTGFLSVYSLLNQLGSLTIVKCGITFCFSGCSGLIDIKIIKPDIKEIRTLKKQGAKKFKKQEDVLKETELDLKNEQTNIQNDIDKITAILEHINFFEESANNCSYQTDTEEYKSKYVEKANIILEDYLNEIKYESIHLETNNLDNTQVRKLIKESVKNSV